MIPTLHALSFMRSRSLLLLLILGVLVFSGCMGKSLPPNLYILSSMPEQKGATEQKGLAQQVQLGIGPLTLADYLDQPKLVTRSGDNQLIRAEFEQWGGSFKKNITTVLTENLGYLMATNQVHLYPWQRSINIDYQIAIDIIRLDGILGEEVMLVARWSIFDSREEELIQTKRSTIVEPVGNAGYAALVSAQSQVLGKLSRDIAETLQTEIVR